ncbi:MAG: BatA domain-containing protein [Phycisphaeraceae bacterium]
MSFLAPLFLAGIAAVSLPILFHLIRRTPKGRMNFSSLMFLTPSPPRVTSRSRLEHWLLLLLRVLAVILLALAFARPFLWDQAAVEAEQPGAARRVVVLIDTSASMSREDLWSRAVILLKDTAKDLKPTDTLGVFAFDRSVQRLLTFEAWTAAPPGQRLALVDEAIANLKPTQRGTNLGEALVAAADALNELDATGKQSFTGNKQAVLISDVQQGGDLKSLDAYDWPADVTLEVKAVAARKPTNAGVQVVTDRDAVGPQAQQLRLRITNAKASTKDRFQIEVRPLVATAGQAETIDVYVPAGESRVVRVEKSDLFAAGGTITLRGDNAAFDNEAWRIVPPTREVTVIYIGSDPANDVRGLHYYLTNVFLPTSGRTVKLTAVKPGDALDAQTLTRASLIIVGESPSDAQLTSLCSRVEQGATALVVLRENDDGLSLASLLDLGKVDVREANVTDYAMLSQVDFTHALFAPFADPRFSDFTKIRFWKHRTLEMQSLPAELKPHVLARFDDASPALVETTLGQGTCMILASSWAPADGQLALSSKFVPLMNVLLEQSERLPRQAPRIEVGDAVDLSWAVKLAAQRSQALIVTRGTDTTLGLGEDGMLTATDEPGLYTVAIGPELMPFAVALSPGESETSPMTVDEFEKRGVRLFQTASTALIASQADRARQMRMAELENRHKLWRWMLVAALGILALESWLAGYFASRAGSAGEGAGGEATQAS